ncbi:MAG: rhomboid family intramembrane serine protease [Acidobacteria bacterium]|nr:rhomboid family intramembrane serine protease [Acidobacteriota bacterium]
MPYYRSAAVSFGPPASRVVKQLIIFTSAAFVLTYLPAVLFHWRFPPPLLGLRPFEVTRYFAIWQPVTYLFLHAGFFHLIFNLFALWMFGSDLERLWGPRRFLFYFFLTGIGAGVLNVLLDPSGVIPTVGNSGAVYGILLAYGLLFPDRPIFLWLIIPIKAKWFVAIIGVIAFIGSISGPGSGISHVAHLGGMLFGFLYLRGGGLSYGLQLRYHEWRRARLRKRFEVYMRKHEKKDEAGRWIN